MSRTVPARTPGLGSCCGCWSRGRGHHSRGQTKNQGLFLALEGRPLQLRVSRPCMYEAGGSAGPRHRGNIQLLAVVHLFSPNSTMAPTPCLIVPRTDPH